MLISDNTYPKITEITLQCKFALTGKISVHSISSLLRKKQFQSPVTRQAMPISEYALSEKATEGVTEGQTDPVL